MIPFSTNNEEEHSKLIFFLESTKKFIYYKISDLIKLNQNKLLFLKKNIEKTQLEELIELIKNENITLVINKNIFHNDILQNFSKIVYPIDFKTLEDKYYSQKKYILAYKDLLMKENNTIVNKQNNKESYITETEFNILKLLLTNKSVKKEVIKKNILNLNIEIDTKSLDSHLSRIRKKIKNVGLTIEIVPTNILEIKLD